MTPPTDFDFIIGTWQVKHRRLKKRLVGCDEWTEFDGQSFTTKILGGLGNLEDNHIDLPEGPYRAVALRSFDASIRRWSIWWLDGRTPGVESGPHWAQAFSADSGLSWETNWTMQFIKTE